jgi:hypothetical protein
MTETFLTSWRIGQVTRSGRRSRTQIKELAGKVDYLFAYAPTTDRSIEMIRCVEVSCRCGGETEIVERSNVSGRSAA